MTFQSLMADAKRRAKHIGNARSDEMRRALVQRVCFNLRAALKAAAKTTATEEK